MLPLAASSSTHSASRTVIIYSLLAGIHVVLSKGALSLYPHASSVLLLQLAVGAGLARAYEACWSKAGFSSLISATEAAPLVGSLSLALLAGWHALARGATVDQLAIFSTCAPAAVALAERWFLGKATSYWLIYVLVIILSVWASIMLLASLSALPFVCLGSYFLCMVFYCIYSSYYSRATKQTPLERVYNESLLSCLPCLVVTLICELPHVDSLLHVTPLSGMLLASSTATYFLSSYFGWELRAAVTSTGYAAAGSCSSLVSIGINYCLWDKHGSPWGDLLTAAAISLVGLSQHRQWQQKHRHNQRISISKGEDILQNPAAYVVSILAAAAAVVTVLCLGAAVGAAATRDSTSPMVGTRQQFEQELHLIEQELATLKHKAVDWESNLFTRYTAVAGKGAEHRHNSSSNTSGVISLQHDMHGDSNNNSSSKSSSDNSTGGSTLATAAAEAVPFTGSTDYQQQLRTAASKPINIVVMTGLFWALNPRQTRNCSVDGVPLDCRITADQSGADRADALYYHVPSFSGVPRAKAFPDQLRIAMSLESAVYYTNLDDPGFMCGFDAEMTYRHCAQVVNWYSLEGFKNLFAAPLPFERKKHALVYINSNCGATSGRSHILQELMRMKGKVPVHSYGNCDKNMPWPSGNPKKTQVQRGYKFCVTMENSVSPDYVTEKIWDGLAAGCIPIYLGPATARDMVPDSRGIIMYDPEGLGDASTPATLDALMHEIGSDQKRYEAMLKWKHRKPEDQPNTLFKYLWSVQHTTGECFLCRFLARHRVDPKPRYQTCLFNSTWMEKNGRAVVPAQGTSGSCPL